MNTNEKIYVSTFECVSTEDVWESGEVDHPSSSWTHRDMSFSNPSNGFDTIEDALKAVCDANCFDYVKSNWISFGKDYGEEYDRFDGDFLVDENNCEASASEKEKWKRGETRLWNCHIIVYLEVRTVRELNKEEALEF